jgi:hypothetical protein
MRYVSVLVLMIGAGDEIAQICSHARCKHPRVAWITKLALRAIEFEARHKPNKKRPQGTFLVWCSIVNQSVTLLLRSQPVHN